MHRQGLSSGLSMRMGPLRLAHVVPTWLFGAEEQLRTYLSSDLSGSRVLAGGSDGHHPDATPPPAV